MGGLPKCYYERKDGIIEHKFTYQGYRLTVYGNSVEECNDKKAVRIAEILSGKPPVKNKIHKDSITMDQYYNEWQRNRKGVVQESTIYTNDTLWKHVSPRIGKMKVVDVETRDLRNLQQEVLEEVSPVTANKVIGICQSLLTGAVEDKIISENPANFVKKLQRTAPLSSETNHRALTEDEQRIFFEYAKQSWYYEYFAFLVLTGLRCGEASALQWYDIDYDKNVIHIRHTWSRVGDKKFVLREGLKTNAGKRDIPLTPKMIEVLESQKKKNFTLGNVQYQGLVFLNTCGDWVKRNGTNSVIKAICRSIANDGKAVIEPFSNHAFRSTFATRAIEQGMNPNTLKVILGHSRIGVTMDLYSHVLPSTKKIEMNNLSIAV